MHPTKFLTPLLGKASQCASVIYWYLDDKNSDEVTMMRAWVNLLIAAILFSLLFGVMSHAGTVVVRQSSTPFDAFAVRDQLLQQHQWQELLTAATAGYYPTIVTDWMLGDSVTV